MKRPSPTLLLLALTMMASSAMANAGTEYLCVTDDGLHKASLTFSLDSKFESNTQRQGNGSYGDPVTETWDTVSHYEVKSARVAFYGQYASPAFSFQVSRYHVAGDGYYAHTIYSDGRIEKHYRSGPEFFTGGFRETAGYGYDGLVHKIRTSKGKDQMQLFAKIFSSIPFKTPEVHTLEMTCTEQSI